MRRRANWMSAAADMLQRRMRERAEQSYQQHMKQRRKASGAAEKAADQYYAGLQRSARAALPKATGGRKGGKRQMQELFHELYGRNPAPGELRRLGENAMSKSKRRKRKNKMPAALLKYWREKRKKKNSRRPPATEECAHSRAHPHHHQVPLPYAAAAEEIEPQAQPIAQAHQPRDAAGDECARDQESGERDPPAHGAASAREVK